MIYYQDQNLMVRDMEHSDPQTIAREETAQGWNQTPESMK